MVLDASFRTFMWSANPNAPTLARIFELLRGYDHVVIGGQARNAYLPDEARLTRDIDVIVPDDATAVALAQAIAALDERMKPVRRRGHVRVRLGTLTVADIRAATEHPLFAETLRSEVRALDVPGLGAGRVATPEAMIALEVLAAGARSRRAADALLDRSDAAKLLGTTARGDRVRALVGLVHGGADVLEEIEDLRAADPADDEERDL